MLTEQQKEFILKNHKTQSVRQLARQLKVPRLEVEQFLKEAPAQQPSLHFITKHKKILIVISLLVLLAVHLGLRFNTFWLSHLRGDQNQYTALAMKLEKLGFAGYNLRGIDMLPIDPAGDIFSITLSKDEEGNLMRGLKRSGVGYYDMPFFYKGPAFPIALMISHKIFRNGKDYSLVQSHLGRQVYKQKPPHFFSAQFYAVIVPILFDALLMLLTFYLGRILFTNRIGFYAAFMIAINPISILTAQKLWADDMVALFVTLAAILFFLAIEKNKLWLSFLSGISCGIAVLAKQNAGILSAGFIFYAILIKGTFRHLFSYLTGLVVLTGPWFYKVYKVYGTPLYRPPHPNLLETEKSGWFKKLHARPRAHILFPVGIPYLSPLFALAYLTLKNLLLRLRLWIQMEKTNKDGNNISFLWFWILSFFLFSIFYGGGDEHRRMLPTYPAIAVLSAYILNKARELIKKLYDSDVLSEILIIILLIACAFWSVPMGLETVMENGALIMKPF